MADWNCVSKSVGRGEEVENTRSNGVQLYRIQAKNIAVEGGSVEIEVDFGRDWGRTTENIVLSVGGKKTYTDLDGGEWYVYVASITGDGLWATAVLSVCYYGNPYAQITNLIYPTSVKEGDEFDCTPSVCNTGNLGGSFDIKYYEGTTLIKTVQHGRFDAGDCHSNLSGRLTMPDHDLAVTVKMCLRGTTTCYDERTVTILLETVVVGNGFSIHVANSLESKTITVGHVVKMPFIGLVGPDPNLWYWPQVFDYVGGKWYMVDPATTYRIEVGSVFETIPSFDKTYGTGSFADGIHCVILAEGTSGVNTLVFKGADVFQLHRDSPTEVNLATTSNDTISEAIMGPVCDLFGIPRGNECNAFWAEFFDPMFVANYISIKQTGKDLLGNSRELTAFDHIALPFAVLGSLPGLSLLPFGALVTKGLGAVAKSGAKFGDEAVQFMLNFSMDASNFVSTKDTWYFLDAIGQVTEAHATEIVNALTAGDTGRANTLLRQYAGESKGWWDYHTLNDLLRAALPADAYNWLRTQIGLDEIGAGTVTNIAKQATLSADDVAKLADAALDSGVMDEATAAVYNSIKNLDTASFEKLSDLRRIIRNSDGIADNLLAMQKGVINKAVDGAALTDEELKVFLNYCTLLPINVGDIAKSMSIDDVGKLFNGDNNQVIGSLLKQIKTNFDVISSLGVVKQKNWIDGNINLARKALDSADPAKMSDIPAVAQDIASNQGTLVADYCGGHFEPCYSATSDTIFGAGKKSADEIVAATDEFVNEATSNWITKGKAYSKARYNKIYTWFDNLSEANKEKASHGMMAAALFFSATVLYKIYTDAGPQSLNHNLFASKMESLYWPCFHACEDGRADDLDAAIKLYESVINECAENLYEYKSILEADGTYEEFSITLQIHQFNLSTMKSCLEQLQPCGNIHCTSNTNFFYVDLDGQPAGFSYANYEVLLTAVKTGSHTVRIHKHLFTPECAESVNVVEGVPKTVDCQMTQVGDCSPVTAVSIYIDPLSPIEDQVVSFNGSAKSDDPINTWEWDFGDGSPNKLGQAVTHTYSKADVYTVVLKVTNDCGEYATTTRNVTVSEEEPHPESTTLSIRTPIGTDGNEIPRYWDIEIWVDGKDTACNPPKTLTFGTDVFCDCTSPWNLVPCELGDHTITLKKSGYETLTKTFTLIKDVPQIWESPVMEIAKVVLTLRSNQTEFDGYIDGVHVGNSGEDPRLVVLDVSQGVHTIKISKGVGYSPEYCETSMVVERHSEFICDMYPVATHNIDLVIPVGAELWVDGKLIETTVVGRLSTILKDLRTK